MAARTTNPGHLGALALATLLTLTACGGTEEIGLAEPEAIAFAEDPTAALDESDTWWADFEARHLCATQRTTHESIEGPNEALDLALAAVGRQRSDYDDFAIRLQTEQRLRDAVRYLHQRDCMG